MKFSDARELGQVVRTMFLLNYINDIDLRCIIQSATCKSEEFNNFIDWISFGRDGVIEDNLRANQKKKCIIDQFMPFIFELS
jgi:TnpA family transposase